MSDDNELEIFIDLEGDIQHVYSDTLVDMFGTDADRVAVGRASHVEPHESGGWSADMSPVGGPVLLKDGVGFPTRAEALQAERKWLADAMSRGHVSRTTNHGESL